MPHRVRKLLLDLILTCEEIQGFTHTRSFEDFRTDRILQLALERSFEIIGEALSRLERVDPEGLARHIPEYRKIIGFRNVIAHGYDVIDDAMVWDFALNRIPALLEKVRRYPG